MKISNLIEEAISFVKAHSKEYSEINCHFSISENGIFPYCRKQENTIVIPVGLLPALLIAEFNGFDLFNLYCMTYKLIDAGMYDEASKTLDTILPLSKAKKKFSLPKERRYYLILKISYLIFHEISHLKFYKDSLYKRYVLYKTDQYIQKIKDEYSQITPDQFADIAVNSFHHFERVNLELDGKDDKELYKYYREYYSKIKARLITELSNLNETTKEEFAADSNAYIRYLSAYSDAIERDEPIYRLGTALFINACYDAIVTLVLYSVFDSFVNYDIPLNDKSRDYFTEFDSKKAQRIMSWRLKSFCFTMQEFTNDFLEYITEYFATIDSKILESNLFLIRNESKRLHTINESGFTMVNPDRIKELQRKLNQIINNFCEPLELEM